MTSEQDKARRWMPKFTLAGLFVVVTLVCVRMAVESHRLRTRRLIEIRIELASAFEQTVERQLRSGLSDVDGVTMVLFGDRFIRVRMQVHAKQAVLEVLERHGIPPDRVQDIF